MSPSRDQGNGRAQKYCDLLVSLKSVARHQWVAMVSSCAFHAGPRPWSRVVTDPVKGSGGQAAVLEPAGKRPRLSCGSGGWLRPGDPVRDTRASIGRADDDAVLGVLRTGMGCHPTAHGLRGLGSTQPLSLPCTWSREWRRPGGPLQCYRASLCQPGISAPTIARSSPAAPVLPCRGGSEPLDNSVPGVGLQKPT